MIPQASKRTLALLAMLLLGACQGRSGAPLAALGVPAGDTVERTRPPDERLCPDGQRAYFGVCPGQAGTPPAPVAPPVAEPPRLPRRAPVTPAVTPPPRPAPPADACADCPELVRLPGGSFLMGSPESEPGRDSDERQHRVTVSAFAIGKYEVTQAEWRAVMGNNPSDFAGCDRCPVEQVSWNDVQQYLGKLNARTGQRYRLPTEAEWEYACRARGSETYCGADSPDPVAWYDGNLGDKTHPVGQKRANRFGLHDMSGNVWEWTCSAYTEGYEGDEKTCTNDAESRRVGRGGSWFGGPDFVRSANRYRDDPTDRSYLLGFRLAQD